MHACGDIRYQIFNNIDNYIDIIDISIILHFTTNLAEIHEEMSELLDKQVTVQNEFVPGVT